MLFRDFWRILRRDPSWRVPVSSLPLRRLVHGCSRGTLVDGLSDVDGMDDSGEARALEFCFDLKVVVGSAGGTRGWYRK
jgi:hypothetical protein